MIENETTSTGAPVPADAGGAGSTPSGLDHGLPDAPPAGEFPIPDVDTYERTHVFGHTWWPTDNQVSGLRMARCVYCPAVEVETLSEQEKRLFDPPAAPPAGDTIGWQPIASAPHGTWLMTAQPGLWQIPLQAYYSPALAAWCFLGNQAEEYEPTLWQPLPAVPALAAEKESGLRPNQEHAQRAPWTRPAMRRRLHLERHRTMLLEAYANAPYGIAVVIRVSVPPA